MKPLTMEDAENIYNKIAADHGEKPDFSTAEDDVKNLWLECCHEIQSYLEENSK